MVWRTELECVLEGLGVRLINEPVFVRWLIVEPHVESVVFVMMIMRIEEMGVHFCGSLRAPLNLFV